MKQPKTVAAGGRKPLRLPLGLYRESQTVFSITICVRGRQPVFADLDFGRGCVASLAHFRNRHRTAIYAYCLMPDHVHLLIANVSRGRGVIRFVQQWKSSCYQLWRRLGHPSSFWQRSFFDRALRDRESPLEVALYILHNPVRAGLVRDYRLYPLCGSMEWVLWNRGRRQAPPLRKSGC